MDIMITGCSRGVGFALARALAAGGHCVFATARHTAGAVAGLAAEFSNIIPREMDIVSEDAVRREAERIAALAGGLDIVVSNAGVSVPRDKTATVLSMESEDLEAMLAVNVVGAARVIRHFGPLVRPGGIFATITSEAGSIGNAFPAMPGYSISKAAENKLVSIQHATVAGYRVLAIHPGRVDTDMGRESAQITPQESADGICSILTGGKPLPANEWFLNYRGEPMPH